MQSTGQQDLRNKKRIHEAKVDSQSAVSKSKNVVLYTLMHNRGTRSSAPTPSSTQSHSTLCTHLVAGVGIGLPLGDDHGLEVLALSHLGLDLLDVLGEVGCVLQMVSSSTLEVVRVVV